ncbi:MAG: hypothetical protein WAL30_03835 [Candidatus Aquirickettsiella sp.]
MSNLATTYNIDEITYYYSIGRDASQDLMKPLIKTISDYDPLFRQSHKKLSDKVADVLGKDELAIQQFTDLLAMMKDKITGIKKDSLGTRNELAHIRDDLLLSIRSAQSKIDHLEGQKAGLQGRKETLEKEISQKQKEIQIYKALSWFIPILAIILESVRAFDSLLEETKTQLDTTQQEIQSIITEKNNNQQVLEESTLALNANQRLISGCDNIQNNISNIQISLKRIDKLSLLKNKLMALENDWSALMTIVNEFISL